MEKFGIRAVVSNGLCVGCGACAVVVPDIKMTRDQYGVMQAIVPKELDNKTLNLASAVCPFSSASLNEDEHAEYLWEKFALSDDKIGSYLALHAGRVNDQSYLLNSSSGGLTSWVCIQLMKKGLIDGVIHVGPTSDAVQGLYEFQVSRSIDELRLRRKSQYYSVSANDVLCSIKGDGKRYAFVGVPCFIKALRNIERHEPAVKAQIVFALGLVCGHMKSSAFAELMAWQVGVRPEQLASVDFRVKDETKPASRYAFAASAVGAQPRLKTSSKLIGGNWGHAAMQLNACNYCDDIFAELADVTFGDAWIPQYESVWQGTNIVVSRNVLISEILEEARNSGEIALDDLTPALMIESQNGNFRHRREGLAQRLADDDLACVQRPAKRVVADGTILTEHRREIVRLRRAMGHASHDLFLKAKAAGSIRSYIRGIARFSSRMDELTKPPLLGRAVGKLMRLLGFSS